MKAAVLALMLLPGVASAQVHRATFDDVAAGERAIRITAGGVLSGNSLSAAQVTAVGRIASDFTPADVLLLGGLTPAGTAFRIGSSSDATVLLTIPGRSVHVGVSASAQVTASGYIPASLTELVSAGLQDTVLRVDLDGLAAASMMRAEGGVHVVRARPRSAVGIGLRVARAVPIADVELKGIGNAPATIDVQGAGLTSSFAIHGPRTTFSILGDAYYERRLTERVSVSASALGFGITRVTRNTAAREVFASAQTWSEFTDMIGSIPAEEAAVTSESRFVRPRVLLAARLTDGPLAFHVSAGKPYDGAPVSALQIHASRQISALRLTAGTMLTPYGAGWAGGVSLRGRGLIVDFRAAGDGGMRIERSHNIVVSSTLGFAI